MPTLTINGARLYYSVEGEGPETVVFSHGLLMSSEMFRAQVEALKRDYRCICYDHRGQGRSEVTADGYDMDSLTVDAAALIGELRAAPCHFVGLSMGGFVGMRLAIRHPELLRSLVLMETSADPEPNRAKYRAMSIIGRWFGFRPLAGALMKIMFGHSFLSSPERNEARERWRRHFLQLDRTGAYRSAQGVIDRLGVYEDISRIAIPTLVIVGDEDIATVPGKSRRIANAIPGAQLVTIPEAGHSSSVEQPERVARAIRNFIQAMQP